jgi:hypothetical protein
VKRAAALGLAAIPLLLFWKAVLRGEVLYQRDIHLIWYGQVETFVRAVASGSWPVWDPYTAFGQPLLANPDAQVLYPPTWLNLLMRPGTYYTLFVVAHLVFSGLGLRLLALRLGCSEGGAFVGAALWIASGPLLSAVSVWHHFASAAWAPWVFLAADRALATARLRDAGLWGAALAAQILAGSADMTMLFGLPLAAFVVLRRDRQGTPLLSWPRLLSLGAAAGVTALALSAALWLPTLDVVRRSARADLPADVRTSWSVHPVSLLQVFLPVPFQDLPLHPRWREALFDSREPFLASLYLGAAALPLVLAALLGRPERLRILGAATLAGAALFALGKHAAFYSVFTWLVPPLRILRYPSKAMVLAAFAWALLAAIGYDEWRRVPAARARWRLGVGMPVFLLAGLAGGGAALVRYAGPALGARLLDPQIPAVALPGVLGPTFRALVLCGVVCAAAGVLAWARAARAASWPAVAVAVLAVGDLVAAHLHLNPTAPEKVLAYRPPTLQWIEPQGTSRLYVYDYYGVRGKSDRYLAPVLLKDTLRKLREEWPYPFAEVIAHRDYLLPPTAALFRLFGSYDIDLRGLEPFPLSRLSVYLRATEGTPVHLSMLRMGAVSRVVARHTEGFADLEPLAVLDSLMGPIRLYRVPDPLPRAYAVSGARIADGEAAFRVLLDASFDPSRELILPDGRPAGATPSFSGSARIVELRADRVGIEAELSDPGYVVLVDAYDPGWRASVDGREAPLLRANIAFRAVAVPAGRHAVELVYRPRSLLAGLAVSGAATLLALAASLRSLAGSGRAR